jgi:16S rRNA (cytosine967-C5)-methyltransferase
VAELAQKQYSIMAAAAQMLKPGGRLVYATCSILHAENQRVVERFVTEHGSFVIRSASEVLKAQQINVETGEFLELYPHRHGCDGFFAAVFERL